MTILGSHFSKQAVEQGLASRIITVDPRTLLQLGRRPHHRKPLRAKNLQGGEKTNDRKPRSRPNMGVAPKTRWST